MKEWNHDVSFCVYAQHQCQFIYCMGASLYNLASNTQEQNKPMLLVRRYLYTIYVMLSIDGMNISFTGEWLGFYTFVHHFKTNISSLLFFTVDILICHAMKSTSVTNNINDGSVLLSQIALTVRLHNNTGSLTAKWNSAIIDWVIYTCVFPTVSSVK